MLIFNESFKQLKKENFQFIFSNYFILLNAPILFFLGMSLMFAFVEKKIREMAIGPFTLYEAVNYFTSSIYYLLLLFYLYRQNNFKYERISKNSSWNNS
jgi:hypothetical protein